MPAAPVGRGRGATMPAWMTQGGAAPARRRQWKSREQSDAWNLCKNSRSGMNVYEFCGIFEPATLVLDTRREKNRLAYGIGT